jgi:mutator protein MutT
MSAAESTQRKRVEIAVAVVEHDDRLLIGRREGGAPLAGMWEFPGGKVESHETPQAAAIRECREETGLLVRVVDRYPSIDYDYEHAAVRLHFFQCAIVSERGPLAERFRWVARRELRNHSFPPANQALLDLLLTAERRD